VIKEQMKTIYLISYTVPQEVTTNTGTQYAVLANEEGFDVVPTPKSDT
jgi:hypothetical protein